MQLGHPGRTPSRPDRRPVGRFDQLVACSLFVSGYSVASYPVPRPAFRPRFTVLSSDEKLGVGLGTGLVILCSIFYQVCLCCLSVPPALLVYKCVCPSNSVYVPLTDVLTFII